MAAEHLTTDEVWKAIPRLPGHEVSDRGQIRTYLKAINVGGDMSRIRIAEPRILKPILSARGYRTIRAMDDQGVHRTCQMHRLVLEAFVGLCPDRHEGCHKDGSRTHNWLDNLYWGTRKQNCYDTSRHGRNRNAVLTQDEIQEAIKLQVSGVVQGEIAERFGVRQCSLSRLLTNRGFRKNRERLTQAELDEMVAMRDAGVSHKEIAIRFRTSVKMSSHYIQKARKRTA